MKLMNGKTLALEDGADEYMPSKASRSIMRACDAYFARKGLASRRWRSGGPPPAVANGAPERRDGRELLDPGAAFLETPEKSEGGEEWRPGTELLDPGAEFTPGGAGFPEDV